MSSRGGLAQKIAEVAPSGMSKAQQQKFLKENSGLNYEQLVDLLYSQNQKNAPDQWSVVTKKKVKQAKPSEKSDRERGGGDRGGRGASRGGDRGRGRGRERDGRGRGASSSRPNAKSSDNRANQNIKPSNASNPSASSRKPVDNNDNTKQMNGVEKQPVKLAPPSGSAWGAGTNFASKFTERENERKAEEEIQKVKQLQLQEQIEATKRIQAENQQRRPQQKAIAKTNQTRKSSVEASTESKPAPVAPVVKKDTWATKAAKKPQPKMPNDGKAKVQAPIDSKKKPEKAPVASKGKDAVKKSPVQQQQVPTPKAQQNVISHQIPGSPVNVKFNTDNNVDPIPVTFNGFTIDATANIDNSGGSKSSVMGAWGKTKPSDSKPLPESPVPKQQANLMQNQQMDSPQKNFMSMVQTKQDPSALSEQQKSQMLQQSIEGGTAYTASALESKLSAEASAAANIKNVDSQSSQAPVEQQKAQPPKQQMINQQQQAPPQQQQPMYSGVPMPPQGPAGGFAGATPPTQGQGKPAGNFSNNRNTGNNSNKSNYNDNNLNRQRAPNNNNAYNAQPQQRNIPGIQQQRSDQVPAAPGFAQLDQTQQYNMPQYTGTDGNMPYGDPSMQYGYPQTDPSYQYQYQYMQPPAAAASTRSDLSGGLINPANAQSSTTSNDQSSNNFSAPPPGMSQNNNQSGGNATNSGASSSSNQGNSSNQNPSNTGSTTGNQSNIQNPSNTAPNSMPNPMNSQPPNAPNNMPSRNQTMQQQYNTLNTSAPQQSMPYNSGYSNPPQFNQQYGMPYPQNYPMYPYTANYNSAQFPSRTNQMYGAPARNDFGATSFDPNAMASYNQQQTYGYDQMQQSFNNAGTPPTSSSSSNSNVVSNTASSASGNDASKSTGNANIPPGYTTQPYTYQQQPYNTQTPQPNFFVPQQPNQMNFNQQIPTNPPGAGQNPPYNRSNWNR